jgi:ribosome biogenesis GTPase
MPLIRTRVSAVHRGTLELLHDRTPQSATLGPLLRILDDPLSRPCVGDWVLAQPDDQRPWLVESIVSRTSLLVRRAAGANSRPQALAANVDIALLFAPLPHGVNVRRLARLAALTFDGGATPLVLLSRADLADRDTLDTARRDVARHCTGVPIAAVSAHTDDGLAELRPWLQPGRTFALLGPSGAGKSTLVNALASETLAQTGDTRADGKGVTRRHIASCS